MSWGSFGFVMGSFGVCHEGFVDFVMRVTVGFVVRVLIGLS